MTLREYLSRRNRTVLIPGAVVTLTVLAIAAYVVLLFVVVIGIFADRARCPKCNARLGYIDFGGSRRWGAPRVGFDRCLSCGLHPNDEIPVRQTPSLDGHVIRRRGPKRLFTSSHSPELIGRS